MAKIKEVSWAFLDDNKAEILRLKDLLLKNDIGEAENKYLKNFLKKIPLKKRRQFAFNLEHEQSESIDITLMSSKYKKLKRKYEIFILIWTINSIFLYAFLFYLHTIDRAQLFVEWIIVIALLITCIFFDILYLKYLYNAGKIFIKYFAFIIKNYTE